MASIRLLWRRSLLACFVLTCGMPAVCAQLPKIWRDSVQPQWTSDGTRFWYRVEVSQNRYEFVLVDTVQKTRLPAFDHAAVAKSMSETLSTEVNAEQLPVDSLEFSQDGAQVLLTGRQGVWRLLLKSDQLEFVEKAADSSAAGSVSFFLPPRSSRDRGGDVVLEIRNQLSEEIQLVWIDRMGGEVSYGQIAAGASRQQHTFVGHVWLIKRGDQRLGCFEATVSSGTILLQEAAFKAVRQRTLRNDSAKRSSSARGSRRAESPDGRWAAFVKDHNLWLRSLEKSADENAERPLTSDASEQHTFRKDASRSRLVGMQYELKDPPAQTSDVRWSPDSSVVLALQTQTVAERRVHYVASSRDGQSQPVLESYPYAKPGDPIPIAWPRLFRTADQQEIAIDRELFANPFRLQFLKFSDDSSRFWMLYNARGHQNLRVLEVAVDTGAVRIVVDETSDTFIHYSTSGKFVLEWLPDNSLLWASERSGWNHLYRYDVHSGQVLNAVTSGDWNVRRIERIDREQAVVWFYAVGVFPDQDPYHEHFCRVHLDGSEFRVLTAGDGTHEIQRLEGDLFFLDRYSRVDLAPVTELRRCDDGSLVTVLETADASEVVKAMGQLPARFSAEGRDGQTVIWGIIHFPRHFRPDQQYPVVENIYAGPHDHHVPKSFRAAYRHQQQLTDRGMIVVQIDGMGTAWRSKAFHDVCFKNLRDAGFPDRIAWIQAAAEQYPAMNLDRVGIYGGSAGGQNAMAALLWHGTFYKVAVADCGCHDNRLDKLWWNEQWMGWPVGEHYAASSNVDNAWQLQGKLLLVVGEEDRNVDPASTTRTVRALIKANKDFDFLLMPGVGHGACERPYAAKRRADFLARHLKPN